MSPSVVVEGAILRDVAHHYTVRFGEFGDEVVQIPRSLRHQLQQTFGLAKDPETIYLAGGTFRVDPIRIHRNELLFVGVGILRDIVLTQEVVPPVGDAGDLRALDSILDEGELTRPRVGR